MSTLAIPPDERIKVRVDAVCHTCQRWHKIETDVAGFHRAAWDWYAKHDPRSHEIEFVSRERRLPKGLDERAYSRADIEPWFLAYRENADIKLAYGSETTMTIRPDLDSADAGNGMESSTTFTAGRGSAGVDNRNTGTFFVDVAVVGKTKFNTNPTAAKTIRLYAYRALSQSGGTPTYQALSDGTMGNSDRYAFHDAVMLSSLGFLGSHATYGTNQYYHLTANRSIAQTFGFVPHFWGLFLTQDSSVVMSTTQGDHVFTYLPSYFTSA